MKIINTVLKNFDGALLQLQDNKPGVPMEERDLLVSDVLLNAALSPPVLGAPSYTAEQSNARYDFAASIHGAREGAELDVPTALAAELDHDVSRLYPVIVAGQIHKLLK